MNDANKHSDKTLVNQVGSVEAIASPLHRFAMIARPHPEVERYLDERDRLCNGTRIDCMLVESVLSLAAEH